MLEEMKIVEVCVHLMHLSEFVCGRIFFFKQDVKLQLLCSYCNIYVLRWKIGHKILDGMFDFFLVTSNVC